MLLSLDYLPNNTWFKTPAYVQINLELKLKPLLYQHNGNKLDY